MTVTLSINHGNLLTRLHHLRTRDDRDMIIVNVITLPVFTVNLALAANLIGTHSRSIPRIIEANIGGIITKTKFANEINLNPVII